MVKNIVDVSEATSTKLQVLRGHNICKILVHSWEDKHSDPHRWRFFQIIPMRSKPESSTTSDRINQDSEVLNEIFIDNAPG